MSFKIRTEHINMIADFMEEHIELARGRLSCANARDEFKRLWAELTNSLNSLGYGIRSTEKWQRTWSDYKLNLKKRAADLKKEKNKTGGGQCPMKTLSEVETKILNILGKTFFEGCGTEEKGFEVVSEILPTNKLQNNLEENAVDISQPGSSNPNVSKVTGKRQIKDDHDYLSAHPLQKRRQISLKDSNIGLKPYYEETLIILRNINNNIQNLNSTVAEKMLDLCNILKENKNCLCNHQNQ